jgi:hypothetical protein
MGSTRVFLFFLTFFSAGLRAGSSWQPLPPQIANVALPGLKFRKDKSLFPEFQHPRFRRILGDPSAKMKSYTETLRTSDLAKLLRPELSVAALSAAQRDCFHFILSGASDCIMDLPAPTGRSLISGGRLDWFHYSRELAPQIGLRRTRDLFANALLKISSDGGRAERAMHLATERRNYQSPSSYLSLSPAERKKVGFFLVLGLKHRGEGLLKIYQRLAQEMEKAGFQAKILSTDSSASFRRNARVIIDELNAELPPLKEAVIFNASKGSQDLYHALTTLGGELDEPEKIKLAFSFSAVLRSSRIAQWLTESSSLQALAFRAYARNPFAPIFETLEGVRSLAEDVTDLSRERISDYLPHLKWVSFVMLPDSELGTPKVSGLLESVSRSLYRSFPNTGPHDTLVESAAQILPPDERLEQYIIRAWGPHGLLSGNYHAGAREIPTAPHYQKSLVKNDAAGAAEVLSAFLRAYSRDW